MFEETKIDSLFTYLNNDKYCDLIIVESDGKEPPNVRLRIYFGNKLNSLKLKKNICFSPEGTMFVPEVYVDNAKNICMRYMYYKAETTYTYKYFRAYDDWFLYSSYDDISEDEFQKKQPYFIWPLYETRAIGLESGEWVNIVTKSEKDSLTQRLNKQYEQFLEEYKTKNYKEILNYEIEEFYSILRYIGINESNVQKLNDIGFFLCEAGRYRLSITVLKPITTKFYERRVAYINLGDAYWGLEEKDNASQAYQKYIELMKESGKESKIPRRVFERMKE